MHIVEDDLSYSIIQQVVVNRSQTTSYQSALLQHTYVYVCCNDVFLLIDHLGSLFDVSWEDPEEAWSITRD